MYISLKILFFLCISNVPSTHFSLNVIHLKTKWVTSNDICKTNSTWNQYFTKYSWAKLVGLVSKNILCICMHVWKEHMSQCKVCLLHTMLLTDYIHFLSFCSFMVTWNFKSVVRKWKLVTEATLHKKIALCIGTLCFWLNEWLHLRDPISKFISATNSNTGFGPDTRTFYF